MLKIILICAVIVIGILYLYIYSKNLVIAPTIDGTLVDEQGQPMAGQTILRSWEWSWTGKTGTDEITTNQAGQFSFPAVTGKSISAQLVPHEPNILIKLGTHHAGTYKEFFRMTKGEYTRTKVRKGWQSEPQPLTILCGVNSLPGPEEEKAFSGQCVWQDTQERTYADLMHTVIPVTHSPARDEIGHIFTALETAREKHNENQPASGQVQALDQYAFQFVYENIDDANANVTIHAMPPAIAKDMKMWRTEPTMTLGGGNEYFDATYNPRTRQTENLLVHGES